jgi:NitT/TauT family transport system substrate-binding protein
MFRRVSALALVGAAAAAMLTACGSSTSGTASGSGGVPTVTLMVGGIDKQIYLPYQLAQDLGFYRKYGVNVQLSTESNGGVGAEDAMASGQVDMAGAWYIHAIDFQQHGKDVQDVVNLSGAPGERVMCYKGSGITSPTQWRGKSVGVTDIGSGTDDLTQYLAARNGLSPKDFTRVAAGAGDTMVSALQHHRIVCGMTTQPTVTSLEKRGIAYSAFDLATTAGVQRWFGSIWPTAGVLARTEWVDANKTVVQKVVDALVATMHWIAGHSTADIAAHMPPGFVQNQLVSRNDYITALAMDKTQFLPDGILPTNGPAAALAVDKTVGKITGPVDLSKTYTNDFATAANKLEGYQK